MAGKEWLPPSSTGRLQKQAKGRIILLLVLVILLECLSDDLFPHERRLTFKRKLHSFFFQKASESTVGRLEKTKFELQAKNAALQEKIVGLQNDLVEVKEEARQKETQVDEREREMVSRMNELEKNLQKEQKV